MDSSQTELKLGIFYAVQFLVILTVLVGVIFYFVCLYTILNPLYFINSDSISGFSAQQEKN
jgi:hypothetical protein